MFNKSLTLNDNQVRTLTTEAYTECYTMKIPYMLEQDDGESMFVVSFPSEDAYTDFMAYIYEPFLKQVRENSMSHITTDLALTTSIVVGILILLGLVLWVLKTQQKTLDILNKVWYSNLTIRSK